MQNFRVGIYNYNSIGNPTPSLPVQHGAGNIGFRGNIFGLPEAGNAGPLRFANETRMATLSYWYGITY
jgi:hypothetical protein